MPDDQPTEPTEPVLTETTTVTQHRFTYELPNGITFTDAIVVPEGEDWSEEDLAEERANRVANYQAVLEEAQNAPPPDDLELMPAPSPDLATDVVEAEAVEVTPEPAPKKARRRATKKAR